MEDRNVRLVKDKTTKRKRNPGRPKKRCDLFSSRNRLSAKQKERRRYIDLINFIQN
jgi:hypothetical protein